MPLMPGAKTIIIAVKIRKSETLMLRTYFQEQFYDMPVDVAQKYADIIREAIVAGKSFDGEKEKGFFLSKNRGFDDKLYVGNIRRIENHLYWKDEELADDDQIINIVVIDGPVTRDGDGCSYGSKDHRDQILYANTIPQVVGHIFILNTPGGAASARIDYQQAIDDCREKGKPTVAWVDGLCASAGQLVAALCDRTIVMNGRHTMGCIGTMCAFWGVPNGTVSQDGFRYIELVSVTSPDKNAEYREAVDGKTEKLQNELDRLGEEFRDLVRANRPLVKEDHLTGKTFEAQEVMGALVDEIGDYTRAIEAVFDLADQKLTAARFTTEVVDDPGNNVGSGGTEEEPEELAKLTDQQKGAVAANAGAELTLDDGHVKKTVDTMFGPADVEIANPQNQENMPQEEIKDGQVVATEAAAQEEEAPVTEQPAGEENPATEEQEAPAGEDENPAVEEEAPSGEENPATEEQEAPAAEQPSEETVEKAQEEIDRIADTLKHAEEMVADKDKTIEQLNAAIATKDEAFSTLQEAFKKHAETIASQKKTIEELTQRVAELGTEIKELSGRPTPMATADSGIPADNGNGEAPKPNKHQRIKRGMSYSEIRAIKKEQ